MGLQELTPDISKLVNLEKLSLTGNFSVTHIPESISCLQKLELLEIGDSPIQEMPAGIAHLRNLATLYMQGCNGVRFPPDLQVRILPDVSD